MKKPTRIKLSIVNCALSIAVAFAAALLLPACETDTVGTTGTVLTLAIPEGVETRLTWTPTGTTGQWQAGDVLYIAATYTDAADATVATQRVAATRTASGTWSFNSNLPAPAEAEAVTIRASYAHLYNTGNTAQNALVLVSNTHTTQLTGVITLNAFELASTRIRFTGLPTGSTLSFDAYDATTHPWHIPAISFATDGVTPTSIPNVSTADGTAILYVDAAVENTPLRFRIGNMPSADGWYTFNPGQYPQGAANYHGQQYNVDCSGLVGNNQGSDGYMDKLAEEADALVGFMAWAERCRNTQATRADITEDFTLTGDIDLTGVEWVPIGAPGNPYYGTFDGGGHTIKGLKVNVSGNDDAGLFGNFSGVVKNLTVEGANVKGTWDAGAIVGYNAGACIIACRAINCTVEGGSAAGGIVGLNLGVVVACHTKGGSIQGYYSGGIAGVNNYNKIIACVAEPETVTGSGSTGVLVGENSAEGLLTTCYWRAGTGATGAIGKDYTNNPHTTTELEAGGITPDECDAMNDAIENYNNNLKGHEAHKLCTFRWSSTSIPGSGGGITIGGFDDEGEIPVGAIDN